MSAEFYKRHNRQADVIHAKELTDSVDKLIDKDSDNQKQQEQKSSLDEGKAKSDSVLIRKLLEISKRNR